MSRRGRRSSGRGRERNGRPGHGARQAPDDFGTCRTCDGSGEVIACIDDLCVGRGECMHDDGMDVCPDCDGTGDAREPEEDEPMASDCMWRPGDA